MLGPLYIALDRSGRPDPAGVAQRLNAVPPWLVRRIARAKLAHVLRHVWRNSPAQRAAWQAAGLRYRDLSNPAVLPRIPFCDKALLVRDPEAFFCVPPDQLIHVITTAGTTGERKKLFFTRDDLRRQTRVIGTSLRRLPGASRALALFRLSDPTWTAGAFIRRGLAEAGFFGLLAGSHESSETIVGLIREFKINLLISTATSVHRLTVEAPCNLKSLGVKYIVLAAQAWTENLRHELESAWGAKVLDGYGTNECGCGIASECVCQNGLNVSQADFWLEVVDPVSGAPVEPGVEGELVVTTLSRRGMPLVRYRIRDLGRFLPHQGRCKCGLPLPKIARIKGRVDDMIILGTAQNVFPDEFDEALLNVPGVNDYQLTVERESYLDVLHLTVETDMTGDLLRSTMLEALRKVKSVKHHMDVTQTVKVGRIERVPRGALTHDRPKSRRIIDTRVV